MTRSPTFAPRYVFVVWVVAAPIIFVVGLLDWSSAVIPTLAALILTFPLFADRPGYRGPLVGVLFAVQVLCAYGFIMLGSSSPRLGPALWYASAILPFVLAWMILRSARRELRSLHTAAEPAEEPKPPA